MLQPLRRRGYLTMAKEAIDKPENFDNDGTTPVIELESREVKTVDREQDVSEGRESAAQRPPGSPSASIDVTAGLADSSGSEANTSEEEATEEPLAATEQSPEDVLKSLSSTLANMREGRDALSMRRDLVSLHDKLIPEIQASRDAALQSESAIQSATEATNELKALLSKLDQSISGLEGYLLVNLEERLQSLGENTQATGGSPRIPRWLKLAIAGNLLLTALALGSLLWPEQSRSLIEAISTFSFDQWLKSLEPRP